MTRFGEMDPDLMGPAGERLRFDPGCLAEGFVRADQRARRFAALLGARHSHSTLPSFCEGPFQLERP